MALSEPSLIHQPKPLTIAVLIKQFHLSGGAERYAVEVTSRLAARGHSIDLYTWKADRELTRNLTVIQVPNRMKFSGAFNLWSFGIETAKLLKNRSYDAIISHDRTFSQDIAVIHTFSYRTGLGRYPAWRIIDQIWLSPRAWIYLGLEKTQMNSKALVPVSSVIDQDIIKHYGNIGKRITITPGVDTKQFSPSTKPEDPSQKSNDLKILFVGSEFRRKGLDILIPAVKPGMKLMIAGRGERLDHYHDLVQKTGNTNRVIFLGLQKDILPLYQAADVVVLPSFAEAFGMTVLEGMAMGLPVIAGSRAGAAALIQHGRNGFICKDTTDLAALLEDLKNPELRVRIGEQARKTAIENTWDKCAEAFESLCFEIAHNA